jgi:hypothetical protein
MGLAVGGRRGLRNDEVSTLCEKSSRALGYHRRAGETPSHDERELRSELSSTNILGSSFDHRHPRLQLQLTHNPSQKFAAALAAVEQHGIGLRPALGQHKAWNPGAGTEVKEPIVVKTVPVDGCQIPVSVLDVGLDWARPKKAQLTGSLQAGDQIHSLVGDDHDTAPRFNPL